MVITPDQLRRIAPRAGASIPAIVEALNPAMSRFGINTSRRAAHFLAQLAHESGQFTRTRESMNYTPQAIIDTFNRKVRRFTAAQAEQYGRTAAHAADQQMIANIAYANRMGNGDMASGDGWKHRGAGWIQLTGKTSQLECADFFDIHQSVVPQWLSTPTGAALSAAWYWKKHGLNELADVDDVDAVSDVINIGRQTDRVGDAIGYNDRLANAQMCKTVLA